MMISVGIPVRKFVRFLTASTRHEEWEAGDRAAIERHPGGSPFSDQHSQAPIVVGIHRPRHESGRSLILIYPGWRAEDASREIRERISRFALADKFLSNIPPVVTFNGFSVEGYVLEPGSDAERVLGDAHISATGKPLQSFMTTGYLDTRVYALYDRIPALCYGPCSENIHGFDERVSLASLRRITATIALFIAEWCGLEPLAPG